MASLVTGNAWRSSPIRELEFSKFAVFPLLLLISSCGTAGGIGVVYLTSNCNATVSASAGGLLEPEQALYYRENIDCTLTLAGLPLYKILLQFQRFALESDPNGGCLDSLTVFDGNTIHDSPLTPELCGRLSQLPDVTSTGSNITFRFRTDDSGRMMGFGIYYTQFTDAPCSSGQFECNNSRCIDQSLTCNSLDMCGDWSDEKNCTAPPSEASSLSALSIIGISAALMIVAYVIVFTVMRIIQGHRSNKLMDQIMAEAEREMKANPYSKLTPHGEDVEGFGDQEVVRKRTSKRSSTVSPR